MKVLYYIFKRKQILKLNVDFIMYPADCSKSDFENEKLNILNTFEIHYLLI